MLIGKNGNGLSKGYFKGKGLLPYIKKGMKENYPEIPDEDWPASKGRQKLRKICPYIINMMKVDAGLM